MSLRTFFRGVRLLRHPELVRRLGDLWSAEREIDELRASHVGAVISSDARFNGWRGGRLTLGMRTQIEYGTIIAFGDDHNGYGTLAIGDDTWIGPYNNLRLAGGTSIAIGRGCLISQFCSLVAANHDVSRAARMRDSVPSLTKHSVILGDDVWLGAGAILLPGVAVGDGAVIAAGAVVTRSVAPYEIWGGNPARKIGERPQ